MAALIPNDTYDSREYKVMDATIRDWNVNMGISEETPDLAQGFTYSSNVVWPFWSRRWAWQVAGLLEVSLSFGLPTRFGMGNETYGSLPGDNYVTIATEFLRSRIGVT